MGSLMAGWDSHVSDPKDVKFKRNKSLTREEIEAFWKLKKQKEEEHRREISMLSPRSQVNAFEEAIRNQESDSSETSLEKLIQKNGWWISSNSAFLNEPPVIVSEGAAKRYAAQFHVADMAKSNTPISFLNEPPVIVSEGSAKRYAAQFHVADMAKSNTHEIGA